MFKQITLSTALLLCGNSFAEIPKNPNRGEIIASLSNILGEHYRGEMEALLATKTPLEAAIVLQGIYQAHLAVFERALKEGGDDHDVRTSKVGINYYKPLLKEVDDLILTLKPKKKKR